MYSNDRDLSLLDVLLYGAPTHHIHCLHVSDQTDHMLEDLSGTLRQVQERETNFRETSNVPARHTVVGILQLGRKNPMRSIVSMKMIRLLPLRDCTAYE